MDNVFPPVNPLFVTTGLTANFSFHLPGSVTTKHLVLRADAGTPVGQHQIGATLKDGFANAPTLSLLPLYVNVGDVAVEEPVCDESDPTISWNPATLTVDAGGTYATRTVTVTNNDSADCSPSAMFLAFDTDQYVSFQNGTQKIRGTGGNPQNGTFTTTDFTLATGLLNPGQSYQGTVHFRADAGVPGGNHQIGLTATDTTNNDSDVLSLFVNVNQAVAPAPGICPADFSGDGPPHSC
jgi:hypothetical protein